jgi:AcrR family transcriptional regulator
MHAVTPTLAPARPSAPRGRPPTPGLREAILAAAEDVFARHDFHQVQMDEVARASGVGKGSLYRHFPSKRALYLAVVFDGIARLRDEIAAATASSAPPVEKVERIVQATLRHFWRRRQFFAFIHEQEHKADADVQEWLRQRARLTGLVQQVVREAIADGALRDVDARIATEMLFGMMRAANRYRAPADTLPALATTVVEVFLRGVGTTAGQRAVGGAPRTRRGRGRA